MILERITRALAATDFTWWDILDILLVAFIVYQLLLFLRGTHAVQMALGALVLVVLYWTSLLANLQTVNWLLRTFLPFLVFGIIVVFQSEIRKVLAHLGKTPLPFLGVVGRRKEEVIDEVVLAATTLASTRTGAIIVIERDMGLRSYIETGIALDALLTYDLLISIFNPELSRTLGSRHRAAIGLSEDTDAVAVVVSEETGIISLVENGLIRRGLDGRELKQALLETLEGKDRARAQAPSREAVAAREE